MNKFPCYIGRLSRWMLFAVVLFRTAILQAQVTDTILNKASNKPFYFSVPVKDGNYKVTVTLGAQNEASQTVVRAESRRLMVENCTTKKGQFKTYSFIVNKRSPIIAEGKKVSLKPRELNYLNWDDLLTLEFNGSAPAVKSIHIEPDTTATTIFLCGNSTVVDQEAEPYASWGQMIPRWFTDKVAISNHAESGLSARTFIGGHRLEKVLSMLKKGDYVICEFGHNDQKEHLPGDSACNHFQYQLKLFIDQVQEAGGNLIFVTPTQRRSFDNATRTKIQETHGNYPDAMRDLAQREGIPVIELHDMTRDFFETLGFEGSKKSLVHYPANTFPGQEKALEDNTHFNPYGAYEVAKMVVMGMKRLRLPIVRHLRKEWRNFDPLHPDDPESFLWYPAITQDVTKPDGDVEKYSASYVLEVVRRVNSYFVQKWPDPTKDTFVGRRRPSSLWTRGVYYEGLMALYGIDPQPDYIKYVDDWATYHKWTPRNGTKTTNADDQCCMQTYLDRYLLKGNGQRTIDSCRVNMEKQMSEERVNYWTWIDAIQMAMPAYAKMYRITGDVRYILFARECYEWSRNECGGGLWNAQEGLWWRDANFVPPYKENDGQNCYWSRGNGWVVAALVRTIEEIENPLTPFKGNKEVSAFLEELKTDYKAMMQALLKCQREDGFWNVSLVSPATFGGPETSGTALFLMGMAWGIRYGILPAKEYRTAVDKAWSAVVSAIHTNGFIGYLQGTGKEPKDGQPVTYTSVPDFEDYGTGCVLLGAVEFYKLLKNEKSGKLTGPVTKAGARWWWLGSAVTKPGLTWQMEQMASHGIRTLEITPLYGVLGNDANNISFISPEWMKMLEYTISEANRLGIQIDMNLGTGWPFGSPETPLSEAACKLVVVDSLVDSKLAKSIMLPVPQKEQKYARLIIQRDYKSKVKGKRRVIALYECRTGQKVKRAAPGGEGYVIDHFDSTAVAHYLSRFDRAFQSSGVPMPATFFNDSYEVFGADWTPTLPKEFESRRGYRLEDKLQEFVDGDAQVISDYRETLSELLLKNFTEQWVKWSHERGVKVRNQAHGSPANLIDIYAAVDIPEIEGFGLSDFGIKGLRTDPGMTRKNYSDLSMLKYASSAAHITGKRLVSSETFTWLTEHFRTSLSQMKPDLDLMFCSGVNRMFFHGACYSPQDDPWPGWRFYASVDMSPTNSIWRDASMLTGYIDFCQQRLQEGEPDNEFLVLLPVRNMWQGNLHERLMLFDINSMDKKAPEFIASILKIDSLGYDCDYISEKYLLNTSYVNGKLQTAAGTRYAALILPGNCILSKAAKQHIETLKRQGAHIISNINVDELGKHAKPEELRTLLHMKMIRRRVGDGYRYFVSNLTPNDVNRNITLASTGAKVDVSLRSGESCFIDTAPDGAVAVTYPVNALQPGNCQLLTDLTNNKWSLCFIESQPAVSEKLTLNGLATWAPASRLSIPEGAQEKLPVDSLDELMGTGVYETTFNLSTNDVEGGNYQIDLGDVRESARVFINDIYVGCAWCVPFILDFDGMLREGENTIRIEVTNLPANRIAAYDRRGIKWRKFNEINVVDINYKRSTYANWEPVPSGLNSYVRIYKHTE